MRNRTTQAQTIYAWCHRAEGTTLEEVIAVEVIRGGTVHLLPLVFGDLQKAHSATELAKSAADSLNVPVALREFELVATHLTLGPQQSEN